MKNMWIRGVYVCMCIVHLRKCLSVNVGGEGMFQGVVMRIWKNYRSAEVRCFPLNYEIAFSDGT